MKLYELLFVVKNELSEEQVNDLASVLINYITGNNGEICFSHYFGIRNLAYEIQKNKKGHYFLIHFNFEPSKVQELDKIIRLNEDIIRHIIVNIEESLQDEVISMLTIKDKDYDPDMDDEAIQDSEEALKDKGYRARVQDDAIDTDEYQDEESSSEEK